MIFKNWKHRQQADQEEAEKVRKELVALYQEKDRVSDELRDMRAGLSIVYNDKKKTENQLGDIISVFQALQNQVNEVSVNFYKLTDKQKDQIQKLNKEIYKKVLELTEYDKKELIDIDGMNAEYKNSLQSILKKIKEAEWRLYQVEKTKSEYEIFLIEESQKLDKDREYIEKTKNLLMKRESKCNKREERLNKLHLELKGKKNAKKDK